MFFTKNVPPAERAIRILLGLVLACVGVFFAPEMWVKWLCIASGVMAACTGFIGFCPMCAMVGRKI